MIKRDQNIGIYGAAVVGLMGVIEMKMLAGVKEVVGNHPSKTVIREWTIAACTE